MNEQAVSTSRRRPSRRGLKVAASLVAGSLLWAGCSSDSDSSSAGGSGGGAGRDKISNDRATIRSMQVCPMIDLKPLVSAMHAALAAEPDDVKPGFGIDPDGVVCAAGLTRADGGETYVASGEINVAVVPYLSEDDAVRNFDDRVSKVGKGTNAKTEELTGAWEQGSLVRTQDGAHSTAYAVVRKDNYLVKVAVRLSASGARPESISAANESTRPALEGLLTSLYDTVSTELEK